jgi:lipopolysaccharide biosynthesis glycosyltransferase
MVGHRFPAMPAFSLQNLDFSLRLLLAGRQRPVATWFDAFYAGAACVMLRSLYDSNRNTKFDTLIFTPKGESSAAQPHFASAFDTLRREFGRRIVFREVDDRVLHRLRLTQALPYLNHATYGNLLLGELVPANTYLYLDCDMVVQEDIAPLLKLDIGNALIGGVADWGVATAWHERLGIDNGDTYVNNGVVLVNAEVWRRENLFRRMLDWHDRLGERATYVDQDLLNVATIGRKLLLEPKWNVMQHAILHQNQLDTFDTAGFRGIFHFTASPKPWERDAPAKLRALYEHHARQSPLCL